MRGCFLSREPADEKDLANGANPLGLNPISNIAAFLKGEATAGLALMAAAAVALLVANSPLAAPYAAFLAAPVNIGVGAFALSETVLHWVNDGLMAVFFFLIGLEIKREVVAGELSTRAQAALPVLAAAAGMAAPAAVYAFFNWGSADLRGWAIPAATDIAFALGIMALLGRRVPVSLKIFLTALAVIDDLGAIVIIAIFYAAELSPLALLAAALCVIVLVVLNRAGVRHRAAYVAVGLILWIAVLKSGVHATMAGVITALAVPADPDASGESPLIKLERALHPWVAFLILPLFAFCNAGVAAAGITYQALTHPVTIGIAGGLFLGKQAGVMAVTLLARAAGWVQLPSGATLFQYYGVAVLTGVGFTMSLFIGNLAFADPARLAEVKIGVLCGSLLSGIVGYVLLRLGSPVAAAASRK